MSIREMFPWLEDSASMWEPVATFASGAIAEPLAGLYGLGQLAMTQDPAVAARGVQDVQDALTYMPRTPQGQQSLANIGGAVQSAMDRTGLSDAIAQYQTQSSRFLPPAVSAGLEGLMMTVPPIPARAARNLPMDEASRMTRARRMGFSQRPWYHGSTHDIEAFRAEGGSPRNYFGSGTYLTSDPLDASANYAGVGPDLKARIALTASEIAEATGQAWNDPEVMALATSQLKGANEGVIYPVMVSAPESEIFDVTDYGSTYLKSERDMPDIEEYMDDAEAIVDRDRFTNDDDYLEAVQEEAYFLAAGDSDYVGQLPDFIESIREQAGHEAAKPIIQRLADFYEGGITGRQLDKIMRDTPWWVEDDAGNLLTEEYYRRALEAAGFRGIKMDASRTFPGMTMNPGTEHMIMFNPSDIRSKHAVFDPEQRLSPNIMAGGAGAALGLGLLSSQREEEDRRRAGIL